MVEIELYGLRAVNRGGRWVSEHQVLADFLNAEWNQPPVIRSPLTPELDAANHAVKVMGATIIHADLPADRPGVVF